MCCYLLMIGIFLCKAEITLTIPSQKVCGVNPLRLYEPSEEICCKGIPYKRKEHAFPIGCCEDLYAGICCGIFSYPKSRDYQCCGGRMQDVSTYGCCGSSRQTPFLRSREICCGDDVMDKNTSAVRGKPHPNGYVCCGQELDRGVLEHITPRELQHHDMCCSSGRESTSFSKRESYCHPNGSVIPKPTRPKCGNMLYDQDIDLCCNSKLAKGEKGLGRRCCHPGTLTFDPQKQACRHGKVIPVTKGALQKKSKRKLVKCGENCEVADFNKILMSVKYNDEVKFLIRIGNKNRWKIVRKIINGKIVRTKNRKAIRIRPRKDIPSTVGEVLYVERGSKQYLTYYDNIQRLSEKIARKQNDHRQP
ncbi:hypothetical protein FSP39_015605 [Pinctada imbricata]|uniref:Galaxin-like repeats domain-containing protein n=1 Tax=Pinctada imbricata TaxID=66713 RepID=A0AA88YDC9_PINIB|nr:hypothetical protein FSP39_015605 [Pinctada imbricata]